MTTATTRSATLNSANAVWSFAVGALESSDHELSDRFTPILQAQQSSGSFAEIFASFAEELKEELNEELARELNEELNDDLDTELIAEELIVADPIEEEPIEEEAVELLHHPQQQESEQHELPIRQPVDVTNNIVKTSRPSTPSKSAKSTTRHLDSQGRSQSSCSSDELSTRRLSTRSCGSTRSRYYSRHSACWDDATTSTSARGTRSSLVRTSISSSQSQPSMRNSFYEMTRAECQEQLQSSFGKLDSFHSLRSAAFKGEMSHSTSATSLASWGNSRHSSTFMDDSILEEITSNKNVEVPLLALLRAELTVSDKSCKTKTKSKKSNRSKSKTRKEKNVSSNSNKNSRKAKEKNGSDYVESSSASVCSGRSSKSSSRKKSTTTKDVADDSSNSAKKRRRNKKKDGTDCSDSSSARVFSGRSSKSRSSKKSTETKDEKSKAAKKTRGTDSGVESSSASVSSRRSSKSRTTRRKQVSKDGDCSKRSKRKSSSKPRCNISSTRNEVGAACT